MKNTTLRKTAIGLLILTIPIFQHCNTKTQNMPQPPDAKQIPKELTTHGHTRLDNYYWMNERENPEVIAYLNAENAYKDTMLSHTKGLQEKLYNEIVSRIEQKDESVPYKKNGYYYYTRYEEGKQHPVYCRKKKNLDAAEEILLNVNEMAKGFSYYSVRTYSISQDNKIIAYGIDTLSRRKYNIHFKNLETGEVYADILTNTTGSIAWANDNKTVFYTRKDPVTLRSNRIFKHKLGSDPDKDETVFEETDETFSTFAYKTKSSEYIIIGSYSTLSTEYQFLDAEKPDMEFSILQPRERFLEYSIDHFGDHFYILTNLDAKNFRLMKTPITKTEKGNWQEVIPHRKDVLLERFEVFAHHLVIAERKDGLPQFRIMNTKNQSEHFVEFKEETYAAWFSANPEFNTDLFRFQYSSMTTPTTTYDYNLDTKEKELKKQQKVLGNFSPDNYGTKRLYASANDGVKVPISLVYKKGIQLDGNNPCLLYAYGSYGNSTSPYFNSVRLSLLDRGFVYAIAHVRGGQEMGRQWYEDGKLLKKMNTFTDFNSCAEHLIKEKYTCNNKLFAMGGSAGGLLMGAIINLRPELYKGVIAAVPFVDVVTTMLDESIPLTTSEFDEWGNPKEKEYYDYMLSYSPYDNVEAKGYPAMLVTTGLHDSQVQYFEPTKWVAKLRDLKTDNNLLVMDIDMDTGHGGKAGRFERHKRTALEYAFVLDLVGITE